MGRAPCCEKVGLNRGPWTKEEDQLLINHIAENGHGNWRALPKKAGLLRCGKSCRLRWTNYLRSDIKRGNFTKEEEDSIILLHQELGNKWSAIATRLPGRTDNEIKNVWHTHLKKRLDNPPQETKRQRARKRSRKDDVPEQPVKNNSTNNQNIIMEETNSPSASSQKMSTSANSSASTVTTSSSCTSSIDDDTLEKCLQLDDDFWADVLSGKSNIEDQDHRPQVDGVTDTEESQNYGLLPTSPVLFQSSAMDGFECFHPNKTPDDEMDFWCNYLTSRDGELQELLENE